jgi:anti-sigma28 factor (negative regulator of flagellin synthesis)
MRTSEDHLMQISMREVENVLRRAGQSERERAGGARSVDELAQKYGVKDAEVRNTLESVRLAEEDPGRARRVRELLARVEAGRYQVDAEAVVDMAERRAMADGAAGG